MDGHVTETQGVDHLQVPLQGWMVECVSIEDAVSVKNADAFISGRETNIYSPAELDEMAAILRRYGRKSAAEMLTGQASRMRAAEFLQTSVGYQRPISR
jgi:uncharacterized small protein (DUF1192 family)